MKITWAEYEAGRAHLFAEWCRAFEAHNGPYLKLADRNLVKYEKENYSKLDQSTLPEFWKFPIENKTP